MQLVRHGPEHLASYVAALERGCSSDNERGVGPALTHHVHMTASNPSMQRLGARHARRLTNRWSQLRKASRAGLLAVPMSSFHMTSTLNSSAELAPASGG